MASNLSLRPLFSFSRIDITTIQSMTSATVNASYDNERRTRPFQALKILLVENNLLGHLLPCHPLFLRKAGPVYFHNLANILHFPHLLQVPLVKVT